MHAVLCTAPDWYQTTPSRCRLDAVCCDIRRTGAHATPISHRTCVCTCCVCMDRVHRCVVQHPDVILRGWEHIRSRYERYERSATCRRQPSDGPCLTRCKFLLIDDVGPLLSCSCTLVCVVDSYQSSGGLQVGCVRCSGPRHTHILHTSPAAQHACFVPLCFHPYTMMRCSRFSARGSTPLHGSDQGGTAWAGHMGRGRAGHTWSIQLRDGWETSWSSRVRACGCHGHWDGQVGCWGVSRAAEMQKEGSRKQAGGRRRSEYRTAEPSLT